MVSRVLVSLVCLAVFSFTLMVPQGIAGGPPVSASVDCVPPCAPAPCGPPPCPPRCGPQFGQLGDLFNMCRGIVGTCLQCPAVIMSGILAPPRIRPRSCQPPACAPAPCYPPPCPVPMCAPPRPMPSCGPQMYMPGCPAPARITKCKPTAYVPRAETDVYEDDSTGKTMLSSSGFGSAVRTSPVPAEYKMLCNSMIEAPFKLAAGELMPATQSGRRVLLAGSSSPVLPPVFGACW